MVLTDDLHETRASLARAIRSLALADSIVAALPKCGEHREHPCPEIALWACIDAAGDPYGCCDEHKADAVAEARKDSAEDTWRKPMEEPYAVSVRAYLANRYGPTTSRITR